MEKNKDKVYNGKNCEILPVRDVNSDAEFLIARSFDINKPGTLIKDLKGGVLGGALKQGTIKLQDEIEIKPGQKIEKEFDPSIGCSIKWKEN